MEINKNTKFHLVKKNISVPTRCCICGNIASGFIYYNVMCCDGCKHFFRRSLNAQELFKCKSDGNCDLMKASNKCKSCRFDKCILMGMNIQKIRNPQQSTISFWKIRSKIEERLGELCLVGKYVEVKNKSFFSNEEVNSPFMVKNTFT
uniref:Nuclear receptor domain-containing protein n=2 Tax=Meloidogyne TaxID=189290 RepID=A0A914LAB1_MELIC